MTATRTPRKPKAAAKTAAPVPGKAGRPTVRTPEIETVIIKAVEEGLHPVSAARVSGISRSTFDRWRKESLDFEESLESAAARFERQNLGNVNRAGSRSWKASAWALERRFPDRWGAKLAIGGTGEPVKVHVVYDDPEPPEA